MSEATEPVAQLEHRLAAVERRLDALEGTVSRTAAHPTTNETGQLATPRPGALWSPVAKPANEPPRPPSTNPSRESARVPVVPRRFESAAISSAPSLADLEARLSGRVLAWVGGVALVMGAVFFLSLAFSRGWIGPELRVVIGLVAAAAAIGAGAWLNEREYGVPALVLIGVGVSVGMLALYAATREYDFIPAELALLGSFILAAGAAAIAIRADSPAVAALGLVAAVAAPPVFDAPINLVTILFLGTALAGGTAIAVWRSWQWLPALGFLLSAPQVGFWLGTDADTATGLVVAAAYWLLNAIGAGGITLRRDDARLRLGPALVLVLNALFGIGAVITLLDGPRALERSIAIVVLAAAHGAIAAPLLRRTAGEHPFGIIAALTALATLAIGVGIEFGGSFRPMGWTALAVAAAWVAIRYRHSVAAAASTVLGVIVAGHLVSVEYPLRELGMIGTIAKPRIPFATSEGVVLGLFVLAIAGVAALAARELRPERRTRPSPTSHQALAAGAIAITWLVAYALPFEADLDAAIVGWAALATAGFLLAARMGEREAASWLDASAYGLVALGFGVAIPTLAPFTELAVDPRAATTAPPLVNGATAALGALAAALVGATRVARTSAVVERAAVAVGAAVVYVGSIALVDAFQLRVGPGNGDEVATQAQVALSIGWVVVGGAVFAFGLLREVAVARLFGLGLLALATLKVFLVDLAELDVAYRVLSFIGLGLVLLGTSLFATRVRRGRTTPDQDLRQAEGSAGPGGRGPDRPRRGRRGRARPA
jgi:uncharacterized membrane protein